MAKELLENTVPEHKVLLGDIKISSLDQALGIFRAMMFRNLDLTQENLYLRKELKKMMEVLDIDEREL